MNNLMFLQVPMPLYDTDSELNVIAMLAYIMEHNHEVTTDAERRRIAQWFHDRYTPA